MPQKNVQLRAASPYERRLAIREELGYYNCLAIGAVYEFADPKFDVRSAYSFVRPLKTAIEKYAYMSVVLKGTDTESPVWERVPKINLDDHIIMQDEATNDDEMSTIQKTFNNLVSIRMNGPLPPWRFSVLPLSPKNGKPRAFVAFALSHSIGDGGAGIAFKQTFLEALRQPWSPDNNLDFAVPDRQLPEPSDTPERLPVSPEFIKSVSSSSVVGAGTWTGSKVFADEGAVQTKVRIVEIEPQHVKAALHASRVHGTKLTPILHHFIVRALSKVIVDKNVKDFASTTAYDLRGASGVGSEWGIYISGLSASHPRANLSNFISEDQWQSARAFSKKLADASSTLNDQVLGMLRFIPNQKESMTSKIGTTREASYAVSNMLTFDGGRPGDSVRMTNLAVVSSAAVPSAPINFLFISIKNGSMMCTINWQPGALGVPLEEEDSFMDRICLSVKADFASFEQTDKAPRARL